MIQLSHPKKFFLFVLPKFKLVRAVIDLKSKKYNCELKDELVFNNSVYYISIRKKQFTKLNFKENSLPKPVTKIDYPEVLPINSASFISTPLDIHSKPVSLNNKPVSLNGAQATNINENPIDINISKNVSICQTLLNHQIQLCQVLNQ